MKAKLLTDKICPDFLYDIKDFNRERGTVCLCWTTRGWNYNESTYPLSQVELITEDGDKDNG